MILTLSPGPPHETHAVTDLSPQGDLSWMGSSFTFRVTGWSMFPTLRHGDVLDLAPAEPVTVGDLVLFRHERTLICHRVVALPSRDAVRTRGDSGGEGELVLRRDLAGKVSAIRRRGRVIDPRQPPSRSPLARCTRALHRKLAAASRLAAGAIMRVAQAVVGSRLLRRMTRPLLGRLLSFSVGLPAPVRLLAAYRFVPIGRRPVSWDQVRPRLGDPAVWPDAIVLARVGAIPLGTLTPSTGSVQVRRVVEGLGVEQALRAVGREWIGLCVEASGERAQRDEGVRTQRAMSASSSN